MVTHEANKPLIQGYAGYPNKVLQRKHKTKQKRGHKRRRVGGGYVGGLSENNKGDADKIVGMRIYK